LAHEKGRQEGPKKLFKHFLHSPSDLVEKKARLCRFFNFPFPKNGIPDKSQYMAIQQTTPDQAKSLLDGDPDAVYVDVRSVPEFLQGHPKGAVNIPLLHMQGGQMSPNPDFQKVAQAVLPKDKTLLVGCKMGGRSQRACEILSVLGYEKLFNVDGGFGGNDHQPGWKDLGLPVSQDNGEGFGYESLLAKAKPSP
jgi:rhodanese-related sulfurtransferase